MRKHIRVYCAACLILCATLSDGHAADGRNGDGGGPDRPTAELTLTFVESETPISCRVRIRTGSKAFMPEGATTAWGDWFACDGRARLQVPVGEVGISAARGLEYRTSNVAVTVPAEGREATIEMRRWIDMEARGYVSGENHVHLPAEKSATLAAAEGLTYSQSLSWWNGPKFEGQWSAGTLAPERGDFILTRDFGSSRGISTLLDMERENKFGALYTFGMPSAFSPDSEALMRGGASLAEHCRKQGALACYQGGWSPLVVLDSLLGYVDVVNVCSNLFNPRNVLLRSRYSNLLEVEDLPVYPDTREGMVAFTTETYERLLNAGARIAAGAGTAIGVKDSPIGYNRAYVRADKSDGIQGFVDGWKAGKNFVTNGPMLFLTVNDDYRPGDVLEVRPGDRVSVSLEVMSLDPVDAVDLIVNGKHIALSVPNGSAENGLHWTKEIIVAESTYLTALAVCKIGEDAIRLGYTSPVYCLVDGKPVRVDKSVEECRRMLEAIERRLGNHISDRDMEAARQVLEGRAGESGVAHSRGGYEIPDKVIQQAKDAARRLSREGLGRLRPPELAKLDSDEAVAQAIERSMRELEHSDYKVQGKGSRVLRYFGNLAFNDLVKGLESKDQAVKAKCVYLLGNRGSAAGSKPAPSSSRIPYSGHRQAIESSPGELFS